MTNKDKNTKPLILVNKLMKQMLKNETNPNPCNEIPVGHAEMKSIVIGGNFHTNPPEYRPSSKIVSELANRLGAQSWSGGTLHDLEYFATNNRIVLPEHHEGIPHQDTDYVGLTQHGSLERQTAQNYGLIVWMPTVDNSEDTFVPRKLVGATLIVSKVMRKDTTIADAVSRIFKFNANAVILIDKKQNQHYTFTLVDALGNQWGKPSTKLMDLAKTIEQFHTWTRRSVRYRSKSVKDMIDFDNTLTRFLAIVHDLADQNAEVQGRHFGNCSTRCSSLFPSVTILTEVSSLNPDETKVKAHIEDEVPHYVLVSKRNTDKAHLQPDDMVAVHRKMSSNEVLCLDDDKPSVDTPVHLLLYNSFPNHNFYIHGHGYIKDVPMTEEYFACGDVREAHSVHELIATNSKLSHKCGALNLLNHGFFIYAETLDQLELLATTLKFEEKPIGKTQVEFKHIESTFPKVKLSTDAPETQGKLLFYDELDE